MASRPAVALRLGMEGKEIVEQGFADVGNAGEAAADKTSAAWRKASNDVTRLAEDAEKAQARLQQSQEKLAAFQGGYVANRGSDSSAQVDAYNRYLEDGRRKAEALRNAIDPLRVAQSAYDREIAIANDLLRRNEITEEEHASALRLSAAALEQVTQANIRGAANDNARRYALQNLGFQAQDFFVQISGGTSALRAFAQQGPQAIGALANMGKEGSKFAAIMGGPVGVGIGIAIPLIGMLAEKFFAAGDESEKASKKIQALGIAEDGLGDRTLTAARAIDLLNKAQLQDRSAAVASAAGSLAAQRMAQANATFTAARAEAQLRLAQGQSRLQDLADGAETTTRTVARNGGRTATITEQRTLSDRRARGQGSELENARNLARQQVEQAQKDLDALEKAFTGTSSRIVAQAIATDTQIRDARLRVATATDAVAQAQARRDGIERRAKIELDAGAISEGEYERRVKLANQAVDAAQQASRNAANGRRELAKDTRDAASAHQKLLDVITQLRAKTDDLGAEDLLSKRMGAINALIGSQDIDLDQASTYARAAFSEYYDQLEKEATERVSRLNALLSPDLVKAGGPIDGDVLKASIARSLAGFPIVEDRLKAIRPLMDELRTAGEGFVDDVLNPDGWSSWGDLGKKVINDIRTEFIKLALINPLKNLISGGSGGGLLPTLSSLSKIGSLFGGGSTGSTLHDLNPDAYASGTEYARGGMAWVGENGKELVRLPRGSQVYSASRSREIAANDSGGGNVFHIDARGSTDPAAVKSMVMQGISEAAPAIALGGAQLAEARANRRVRYRIPGR